MVTRRQLLALGFTAEAIDHRIEKGGLHPVWRGVHAVGRAEITAHGRLMAAVLSCGPDAVLSHRSAAVLWQIVREWRGPIEVSVPACSFPRRPGITAHRRVTLAAEDLTRHWGIPVTSPVCTLVDLATCLPPDWLEAAVNEADKLGLCDPETLRSALNEMVGRPGVAALRRVLDSRTFALTDSHLERRFLAVVRGTGLSKPQTGRRVNGFRVDFYWPDLGLVVETDGLRYHRTAAQQAKDRVRDQAHATAGMTALRFTHAQVTSEPEYVQATLAAVAHRLRLARPAHQPLLIA